MNERMLIINPGSTSTKIAVFDGEKELFSESIEQLEDYNNYSSPIDCRIMSILSCLDKYKITLDSLDAIISRGGLLGSIETGAYLVNDDMVWQLLNKPRNEHASNLGAVIAKMIADNYGIKAYIYDGITVDEMEDIFRITGLPEYKRKGHGHTLNTRAAALKYASEHERKYNEITVIVAHLGGGITINLHYKGKIIDSINDEEGPFSPERSGGLPMFDVIDDCYYSGVSHDQYMKRIKGQGGLNAYFGTSDCRVIEEQIKNGDEKAQMVYEAMAVNIAKNIAKLAPSVKGQVDAILLTGGIAYSEYMTGMIADYSRFIAPVIIYPGENEMRALAQGGLRVLRGEESAKTYYKTDNPRK